MLPSCSGFTPWRYKSKNFSPTRSETASRKQRQEFPVEDGQMAPERLANCLGGTGASGELPQSEAEDLRATGSKVRKNRLTLLTKMIREMRIQRGGGAGRQLHELSRLGRRCHPNRSWSVKF